MTCSIRRKMRPTTRVNVDLFCFNDEYDDGGDDDGDGDGDEFEEEEEKGTRR